MYIKENWFKICLLILILILFNVINTSISRGQDAKIVMFCTKQYDDKATLTSPNTYFGNPEQCLNTIKNLIK